ncbi:E3 ubiquitin-protein ligase RBBP6-like [Chroicocephalus ridibundus]|uniref:E3 ubiquitin-protein ligase RBBP6-like n=1 Tax=Chroicocephalus ridibundus TaxID=1192867 RepID=UPI002FDDE64A
MTICQDKSLESVPRIKKSTGIPRSFTMEVKDPKTKGAMLTNTGKYAIPTINAEASARGKKEKPPFLPSSSDDPIPDELLCAICRDTITDAVVIPCCGNSFCGECIRTALLQSEEHTCPACHQADVSPDALVANKCLRQAVNNFKSGTGYRKRIQQQQQRQLPPPPPSPPLVRQAITRNLQPLLRPKMSRQQAPLMISLASLASPSALASLAPGLSPVAAWLPLDALNANSHSVQKAVRLRRTVEYRGSQFKRTSQAASELEHS